MRDIGGGGGGVQEWLKTTLSRLCQIKTKKAPERGYNSNMDDEMRQMRQNLGSEEWIERALAYKRVLDFVRLEAIEKPAERESTRLKKELFINAYSEHFTIELAIKAADIHRATYYRWKESDPEFTEKLIEIEKQRAEFIDSKIMKLVHKDDGPTIRWFAERTMEKYKAKKTLEHQVSNLDFSDMVDEILDELEGNKEKSS